MTRRCPICNRTLGYETAEVCGPGCERTAKLIAELRANVDHARERIATLEGELNCLRTKETCP